MRSRKPIHNPYSIFEETQTQEQDSLLLSLPGELRNHIYRYLIPNDQVFSVDSTDNLGIKGITKGVTHRTRSIKKRKAYSQYFALAQTCHQLRVESRKFFYGKNAFLLRIVGSCGEGGRYGYGAYPRRNPYRRMNVYERASMNAHRRHIDAKAPKEWIKSLPNDALASLSRIIVMWPWGGACNFTGADVVLFDLVKGKFQVLEVDHHNLKKCFCEKTTWSYKCWCYLKEERKTDFEDVLRVIKRDGEEAVSRTKLIELLRVFRDRVECPSKEKERE